MHIGATLNPKRLKMHRSNQSNVTNNFFKTFINKIFTFTKYFSHNNETLTWK